MKPLLALIFVTAVWGVTFVQVKDAVAIYPLFAFLAIRFVIATRMLAGPAAPGAFARLAARGLGAGAVPRAAARPPGTRCRPPACERTTVSSTGFITGHLRGADTADRAAPVSRAHRALGLGRRRPLDRSVSRCSRGIHAGLGRRRPACARRGGRVLAADRADGALRAAATTRWRSPSSRCWRRRRGFARRRGRARRPARAARLDGVGRAAS